MLDAWLPKSAPFFDYLLRQNKIMCALCALVPRALTQERAAEAEIKQEMRRLEEEGDVLYATLVKGLAQTFITPIDREDILRIGMEQENTIDLLQNLVLRLYVLHMGRPWPESMQKIAQNLSTMCGLTNVMLDGLSQRKGSYDMREFRDLCGECDELLSSGLGEAFTVPEVDAGSVFMALKLARAYDRLEQLLIQVVELAEAVKEAVLKNA